MRFTTKRAEFKEYSTGNNICPVKIVTPPDGFYIHTFYDTCPWSPSERYLACLKLPFQDRIPGPEDEATVCIIDFATETITELDRTSGWGLQVGAHICWGADDDHLYYNDKEGSEVFAVEYNVNKREKKRLEGSVYQIMKDGSTAFSPSLSLINYSQNGYGATIDEKYGCIPVSGAPDSEGLWKTDLRTGKKTLIFSLKQAYDLLPDKESFEGGRFVFFHTKINNQQNRLMQVVRYVFDDKRQQNRFIITMDMDGKNPRIALPYELWVNGSHHPNWHPDGERIIMNINLNEMRFCMFGYDGKGFEILCPAIKGGGHPSFSRDGKFILSDAYTHESFVNENNHVPIRLIDVDKCIEQRICYIWTLGGTNIKGDIRCDPHPVWNRDNTRICFNGTPEGNRQILIADKVW